MSEQEERQSGAKSESGNKLDAVDILWNLLRSTKLAIFLLIFISVTSIIGTLIPQNPTTEQLMQYSESTRRLFETLKFFDLYHSWWFQASLAFLCINLLICSLDRLTPTWNAIKNEKVTPATGDPEKMKLSDGVKVTAGVDATSGKIRDFLKKTGGRVIEGKEGDNQFFLLNRGRYSRLGVQFLHFSIILIVLGSLGGNIFGFHGRLAVLEGQSTDTFFRQGKGEGQSQLGFKVTCKSFTFNLNPQTGMPENYTSELDVYDGDKLIASPTLMVNHPYYYKGIGLFQSSYEIRNVQTVNIEVKSKDGKVLGKVTLPADNNFYDAPGGGKLRLVDVFPDMRTQMLIGATIEVDGGDAGKTTIEVHKGHSHAVEAGITEVELIVRSMSDESEISRVKVTRGTTIEGPGGAKIKLLEYATDFEVHGKKDRMAYLEVEEGGQVTNHRLFGSFPTFDKMNAAGGRYFELGEATTIKQENTSAMGNLEYSFVDADGLYATILDVNRDPGVWFVWAGCAIMFIGLYAAFFWSHRKIWIKVAPGRVSVGGNANRNLQAFEGQFRKFVEDLKRNL